MPRIDSGTVIIAFIAILFGLVGAFLLRKSFRQRPPTVAVAKPQTKRVSRVKVPLTSRDLKAGTRVNLDDIALFNLSRDEMEKHGIKRVFMSNPEQIIGKTLAVDLERGSTFDTKNFYPDGTGPGITDKLKAGQRAVTIDVSATNALIGFAGAGQDVDVLFHFGEEPRYYSRFNDQLDRYHQGGWVPEHFDYNPPRNFSTADDYKANHDAYRRRLVGNDFQSATVTLVQDATILALGQKVAQTDHSNHLTSDERVHITLAVSPESAELLRVAEGHGELSLTLRGAGDDEIREKPTPKTLSQIIPTKKVQPNIIQVAARRKPETRDLDIYRGRDRTHVRFTRKKDTGSDSFHDWTMEEITLPESIISQSSQNTRDPRDVSDDRDQINGRSNSPQSQGRDEPFRYQPTLFNPVDNRDRGYQQNQSRRRTQNRSTGSSSRNPQPEAPNSPSYSNGFSNATYGRVIDTGQSNPPTNQVSPVKSLRGNNLEAQSLETPDSNAIPNSTGASKSSLDSDPQTRTARLIEFYDPRY